MEPDLEPVASTSYEGSADRQGRWQGYGKVLFKSGAAYEGQWLTGKMHGRGKFVFPDGISYEGEFQHNQMTGTGVYTWPSGAVYEGTVVCGRREGRGKLSFTRWPSVYEGDFRDGVRHGQGVLYTNLARTSYYRGSWFNDTKHGPGVMKYENGDVYDGHWENDKKKGLGTMRWESGRQQYAGEWDNNTPNGVGLHIWFSEQVVAQTDQGIPSHAQLLMYNRYYGHFKNGRRHGYGVLYYATGARYEGFWHGDQKHGMGCYCFENGEVWVGSFAHDRPVLAPGELFAPASTAVTLQVDDLVAEEENPAASRRAVANILLCYNTELRMLYDKYCKRSSHQLPSKLPRLSFSVLAAQVWEMLNDCRLLSPQLTLCAVDDILATSRLLPERVRQFRKQEMPHSLDTLTAEQRRFWTSLSSEHTPGGRHHPLADLTFRAFCEAVVRLAAARFHALPSLERRVHQCLTLHLLHLVNKAKAAPPAPPAPIPVLPPNTSVEAAVAATEAATPRLVHMFLAAAAQSDGVDRNIDPAAAREAAAAGNRDAVHSLTAPAHALAAALAGGAAGLGGDCGAGGIVLYPLTAQQALVALLWNYLTRNAYGPVQRMTMDALDDAGYRTADLAPEDEQELLFAGDTPLTYAEWVDGVWRIATDWTSGEAAGPAERLAAVIAPAPELPEERGSGDGGEDGSGVPLGGGA